MFRVSKLGSEFQHEDNSWSPDTTNTSQKLEWLTTTTLGIVPPITLGTTETSPLTSTQKKPKQKSQSLRTEAYVKFRSLFLFDFVFLFERWFVLSFQCPVLLHCFGCRWNLDAGLYYQKPCAPLHRYAQHPQLHPGVYARSCDCVYVCLRVCVYWCINLANASACTCTTGGPGRVIGRSSLSRNDGRC